MKRALKLASQELATTKRTGNFTCFRVRTNARPETQAVQAFLGGF